MPIASESIPVIFVDTDVLIAGAASPSEHSASMLILSLAEITLIKAYISEQVVAEAERNLGAKFPEALPGVRHLIHRCLDIIPDPDKMDLVKFHGLADPRDLPILAAAAQTKCQWLVTFNTRHFKPGHPEIVVVTPGEFIRRLRDRLTLM